jgi:PPOX class probable F420-dependent enzyme
MAMTGTAPLALADERFISLTTFRKSGQPVSTAVWIEREGDALIVTTPETSGKVKRVRNDPQVEMRPCNRFGKVEDGTSPVAGRAEILSGESTRTRLTEKFRDKYGLEYRVFMAIEALFTRGPRTRVILRIVPA